MIAEPCVNTKDTACVEVCPVDCIHPKKDEPEFEAETKLYIDPETCIDCGACLPECPIAAIVDSEDQAPEWGEFNKAAAAMWPNASTEKDGWEHRDPSEPPHNPENAKQ